jgi:hypothetical protein
MNMLRVFHLIALGAILFPSIACAADAVPGETGAFLAFCKTHNDGCIDAVAKVSFVMLVESGRTRSWCPTDEVNDVKVLTPMVVQWLTTHPESHSKKTNDGIRFALKQLYACKGGNTAPKPSVSTGDFVVFCGAKANEAKCMDDVSNLYFAFLINEKLKAANNFCEPKGFDVADQVPSVLKWLAAHTDLHSMPKEKAIAKAWGALFPCKGK